MQRYGMDILFQEVATQSCARKIMQFALERQHPESEDGNCFKSERFHPANIRVSDQPKNAGLNRFPDSGWIYPVRETHHLCRDDN